MKRFISKIFDVLKSLFLKLSVMVTLRLGKDKVEDDMSEEDTDKKGK